MNEFTPNSTSFFGNLVAVRQALTSYGIEADAFIREAGINPNEYHPAGKRVPGKLMEDLTLRAIDATGDEAFGLRMVESATPNTYHALSAALLYSSNLRSFFQRFERFGSLVTTLYQVKLTDQRKSALFSLHPAQEIDKRVLDADADAFCGVVLKYVQYVTGIRFVPLKVQLTRSNDKKYAARYANFFGCDIEYDCDHACVVVDRSDLEKRLIGGDSELAQQNEQAIVKLMEKANSLDLPTRVYAKLVEKLPEGECTREMMAEMMNMSPSSFYQKLKESGRTYQEILDETRLELAKNYMKQSTISTSEIAYLLGFHDSSNFSRAFRRWTGHSPSDYRHKLNEKSSTST
ncbi:MAG: AraC family transcriptional regulator [Parasphingorhabdus sp.]